MRRWTPRCSSPFLFGAGIGDAGAGGWAGTHKTGGTSMAWKLCPRCKKFIPCGMSYCDECRPIVEAERLAAREHNAEQRRKQYNKRYNSQRDNSSEVARFRRSKPWKMTSKAKLQACGYKCEAKLEGCGRYACEVHHIKPLKTPEGWEQRLEWSNLMGVCVQCHNKLDNKVFKKNKDEGVIDLRKLGQ